MYCNGGISFFLSISYRHENGEITDKYYVAAGLRDVFVTVRLPAGKTCNHCVFQFRYKAGKTGQR